MLDPRSFPSEHGISYAEIAAVLNPSVPLGYQLDLLPNYPAWWLAAALDLNYRHYLETKHLLRTKHKRLLQQARSWRKALNPECYSAAGKQRSWPRKKNRTLRQIESRLRTVLWELKNNEKQYYQNRK